MKHKLQSKEAEKIIFEIIDWCLSAAEDVATKKGMTQEELERCVRNGSYLRLNSTIAIIIRYLENHGYLNTKGTRKLRGPKKPIKNG